MCVLCRCVLLWLFVCVDLCLLWCVVSFRFVFVLCCCVVFGLLFVLLVCVVLWCCAFDCVLS